MAFRSQCTDAAETRAAALMLRIYAVIPATSPSCSPRWFFLWPLRPHLAATRGRLDFAEKICARTAPERRSRRRAYRKHVRFLGGVAFPHFLWEPPASGRRAGPAHRKAALPVRSGSAAANCHDLPMGRGSNKSRGPHVFRGAPPHFLSLSLTNPGRVGLQR
jgi:hypothetical protein